MKMLASFLVVILLSLATELTVCAEETIARPEWTVGDWWENGWYRWTVSARKDDIYEILRTQSGKAADPAGGWSQKLYMTVEDRITERVEPSGKATKEIEDR